VKAPNILFILIDALRAQNLGCYNPEVIESPSPCIDDLARRGVIFEHCYSCITNTDPAMTSILSGKYPISHGIIAHGHRIKKAQIAQLMHIRFLPEILKSLGYYTIAIDWLGRWHRRGYDSYSGMLDPRAQNIMSRENNMIKQLQRICRVADEILCEFINLSLDNM
jgi:arylsulfatase A-like enzyme